jgi:predicted CoA-binding protein
MKMIDKIFQREEAVDVEVARKISEEDPSLFPNLAQSSSLMQDLLKKYRCSQDVFHVITKFVTTRYRYLWQQHLLELDEIRVSYRYWRCICMGRCI